MKKQLRWLAVVGVLTLVAAACGSDDGDGGGSGSTGGDGGGSTGPVAIDTIATIPVRQRTSRYTCDIRATSMPDSPPTESLT